MITVTAVTRQQMARSFWILMRDSDEQPPCCLLFLLFSFLARRLNVVRGAPCGLAVLGARPPAFCARSYPNVSSERRRSFSRTLARAKTRKKVEKRRSQGNLFGILERRGRNEVLDCAKKSRMFEATGDRLCHCPNDHCALGRSFVRSS